MEYITSRHKNLARKSQAKRPLRTPRYRWEGNMNDPWDSSVSDYTKSPDA